MDHTKRGAEHLTHFFDRYSGADLDEMDKIIANVDGKPV